MHKHFLTHMKLMLHTYLSCKKNVFHAFAAFKRTSDVLKSCRMRRKRKIELITNLLNNDVDAEKVLT